MSTDDHAWDDGHDDADGAGGDGMAMFEPLDSTDGQSSAALAGNEPGRVGGPSGPARTFGHPDAWWLSAPAGDAAGPSPSPRRPELLDDAEAAWWADIAAWADWAIATFRLAKWLPPCWPRHPALVEEVQALWLLWCDAWMSGEEPTAPIGFLAQLGYALGRIETLWQIPCTASDHTEPTAVRASQRHRPVTTRFWSNPDCEPDVDLPGIGRPGR